MVGGKIVSEFMRGSVRLADLVMVKFSLRMVWSISRSLCLSSNSKLNSWTSLSNILSRTTSYESFGMKALI